MNQEQIRQVTARDEKWFQLRKESRSVPPMLDWRLLCHKRKKLFNFGTLLRRSQAQALIIDFAEVPDDETTLAFLINLGYKDVSLELGKYISLTEAAKEEATRQVHATHARIVTETVLEPARRRPSGIAFRDTSSVSKNMSSDPSQKLKGVQTLTPEEQIAADTMKALKESKKTSRRQPGIGGSSEGTGVSPGVPDESTVIPTTSSEGIEYDDELVHANEQVNDDEDEEMTNAEHADMGNGDEEITDTTKVEAEKTKVEKDDIKKAELPPTSSSLSISSGFGN
ncbi:hypothetical protein Tco_0529894 [Tanacetum coccineum]